MARRRSFSGQDTRKEVLGLSYEFVVLSVPFVLLLMDAYALYTLSFENQRRLLPNNLYFTLSVLMVGAFYLRLLYAFVADDFGFAAVYLSSSTSLSLPYKLAASYAGPSVSYLLLLSMVGLVVLSYRVGAGFGGDSGTFELRRRTYLLVDLAYLLLVALVVPYDPLARSALVPPEGLGLNPSLKSFWMMIHPPTLFLGYAFTFVPAAYVSAALSLRKSIDFKHVRVLMECAWLFLTIGVVTGGAWAYGVAGWGGYWSWDPAEVASLMPWLTITAYFHSFSISGTKRTLTKEFMVFLSFLLCLFAMFITRSGWVQSVHAYASSVIAAGMIMTMLAEIVVFFHFRRGTALPLINLEIDWKSVQSVSMAVAYASLVGLTLICVVGEAVPLLAKVITGAEISIGGGYYLNSCYPLTLAFVAGLAGCNLTTGVQVRKYTFMILSGAAVGTILAALGYPTPNGLANFGLPLVLIAAAVVLFALVRSLFGAVSTAGLKLIHLGTCLILLGVLISSSCVLYSGNLEAKTGETTQVQLDGSRISIQLGEPQFEKTGAIFLQGETWFERVGDRVNVRITSDAETYTSNLSFSIYTAYGLFYEPALFSTPFRDYHIAAVPSGEIAQLLFGQAAGQPVAPARLLISVKVVPLVSLIWIGAVLLVIGMILRLFLRSDVGRTTFAPN